MSFGNFSKTYSKFSTSSHPVISFECRLKHKRWSCAAVGFKGDEHIVVIGGRGKWVGNSVEVYDPHSQKFALASSGPSLPNRAYSAVVVTIPHKKFM